MKVETACPSIATSESDLKFDPVINKVPSGTPTMMLEGDRVAMVGVFPPPPPDPLEPPPQPQSANAVSARIVDISWREPNTCRITQQSNYIVQKERNNSLSHSCRVEELRSICDPFASLPLLSMHFHAIRGPARC